MADIDRLKRELNAEIQHRREVEKQEEASRSVIGSLSAENANLIQAKEVDCAMLKRRDRMVYELRADLTAERKKRVTAEDMAKEESTRRDQIQITSAREIGRAMEVAKHATGHAEVLERSHKQLGTDYRQRAETFARDLRRLEEERNGERVKLKRLDVVVEQMGQELEQSSKTNAKMAEILESYKEESERRIGVLQREALQRDAEESKLKVEVQRVVGEARWLLNAGKLGVTRDAR